MRDAGLAAELLESRHVRDALKADPTGSVQCIAKSLQAQETRALLTTHKLLQREMDCRGMPRGFGNAANLCRPDSRTVRQLPDTVVNAEALLARAARCSSNGRSQRSGFGFCPERIATCGC
jgi:hypothetical protein